MRAYKEMASASVFSVASAVNRSNQTVKRYNPLQSGKSFSSKSDQHFPVIREEPKKTISERCSALLGASRRARR